MANMLFVSFRSSRRGELFTEDTFTEGQPQLGVDMATPSLSVLVMSSEILHALDGARTIEGRGGRGEAEEVRGGRRRLGRRSDDRLARCRVPKVRMRHLVASGTS